MKVSITKVFQRAIQVNFKFIYIALLIYVIRVIYILTAYLLCIEVSPMMTIYANTSIVYKGKVLLEQHKMKRVSSINRATKKVRIVPKGKSESLTEKASESRLRMIFDALQRNGSSYRTITCNKPTITDKVKHHKKGRGEKVIPNFFLNKQSSVAGKEKLKQKGKNSDYCSSDDFTSKYIRLAEISKEAGSTLYEITVLFNTKANVELRKVDEDKNTLTMIRKVYNWIYKSNLIKDAIIVIEECEKSFVSVNKKTLPSLHVHILTHLDEREVVSVREGLLKNQRTRLQAKNYWDNKVLFNELHELEEEEFGKVPRDQPDPTNEYWLNQFTRMERGNKYLCVRLPISLDGADYLTKQFHRPFTRDRHDTYIGLEGHSEVRARLFEQSKGINKAVIRNKTTLK